LNLGNLGHLSYSTLVHPGDTWDQMWESLTFYLPKVKQRVAPRESFGVSLRLSAQSAAHLASDRAARDKFKKFLADNDMYVYTVNAFPYGSFKGTLVKEQVYEPDWRSEERTRYTIDVAEVLADIAPATISPSIQSAPLGFKPRVTGEDVIDSFTQHVLRVTARLIELEARTGRCVTLALEPEPYCFLETTDETVAYFQKVLYSGHSVLALAKLARLPVSEACVELRRHVGIVFDIGHQSVGFEEIPVSLQKLVDATIPIFKLQEVAAMRIPQVTDSIIEILGRFANSVYLTQTVEKRDGRFTRFLNLEDAFRAWKHDPGGSAREWRTHFHVPVFLETLGAFGTTRFAIEQALQFHKLTPLSRQLEIETYTWDVLPENLKTGDIVDYVCREIEWVRDQLK
jgi:hypothetical protein